MKKGGKLDWVLAVLCVGVAVGQFFRIEPVSGQTTGLLVIDLLLAAAVIGAVVTRRAKFELPEGRWLLAWGGVAAISAALNAGHYSLSQNFIALAYLARAGLMLSLLPLAYRYLRPSLLTRNLGWLAAALLILAGVVFVVLPDFAQLAVLGWDPHYYRLTGTWLDPNYFGSFLAILFSFFLAMLHKQWPNKARRWYLLVLLTALWLGIYFTVSRSALVTALAGSLAVSMFISWRYVAVVAVIFVLTLSFPSRLQERFSYGVSFDSGVRIEDPTTDARLASWQRAITIGLESPVFGVGYNYYQPAQARILGSASEDLAVNRSSSGSDSSLLNIFATTGLIGLLPFLFFWLRTAARLFSARKDAFVLGAFGVLAAWAVSSFLNNTLFYPLIAVPCLMIVGVALKRAVKNGAIDES